MSQTKTKGQKVNPTKPEKAPLEDVSLEEKEEEKEPNSAQEAEPSETPSLEELEKKLQETEDLLLRERAEFQNFRKRTIKEKSDLEHFVTSKILTELLPTLDSLDQVFHTESKNPSPEVQKVLEGVRLIQKQLVEVFTKFGVEEFNPEGEPFDPMTMEALTRIEDAEIGQETVAQVYQKGYKIKDRVVRAARVAVKVPTNPPPDEPPLETNQTQNQTKNKGDQNE